MCDFVADGTHPNVLMSHLLDAHDIRRKDGGFQKYLDRFFGQKSCCCGCGDLVKLHKRGFIYSLFAPGCDGLNHSRNPSRIEFYLHLGLDTDEAIAVFRDHKSRTAKKYSTEEVRKRLSEINSGAGNFSSYKSIQKRTGKTKEEIKVGLKIKSGGKNNGFYNRGHTEETKKIASIRSALARSKQTRIVTKPEIAVWAWLQSFDVNFDYECFIEQYVVDFLIEPYTVIEVYGDYWHSDRIISNKSGKTKTDIDKERCDFLRSRGYSVYVFWESEVMKSPRETLTRIKEILNANQITTENQPIHDCSNVCATRRAGT
jgi:very-short-patch-repair endonuclease